MLNEKFLIFWAVFIRLDHITIQGRYAHISFMEKKIVHLWQFEFPFYAPCLKRHKLYTDRIVDYLTCFTGYIGALIVDTAVLLRFIQEVQVTRQPLLISWSQHQNGLLCLLGADGLMLSRWTTSRRPNVVKCCSWIRWGSWHLQHRFPLQPSVRTIRTSRAPYWTQTSRRLMRCSQHLGRWLVEQRGLVL